MSRLRYPFTEISARCRLCGAVGLTASSEHALGGRLIEWRRAHAPVCPEWPRWAANKGLRLDERGALLYPNEAGPYLPRVRPKSDGAIEDDLEELESLEEVLAEAPGLSDVAPVTRQADDARDPGDAGDSRDTAGDARDAADAVDAVDGCDSADPVDRAGGAATSASAVEVAAEGAAELRATRAAESGGRAADHSADESADDSADVSTDAASPAPTSTGASDAAASPFVPVSVVTPPSLSSVPNRESETSGRWAVDASPVAPSRVVTAASPADAKEVGARAAYERGGDSPNAPDRAGDVPEMAGGSSGDGSPSPLEAVSVVMPRVTRMAPLTGDTAESPDLGAARRARQPRSAARPHPDSDAAPDPESRRIDLMQVPAEKLLQAELF